MLLIASSARHRFKTSTLIVLVLVLSVALVSCSDGRPEVPAAETVFQSLYPNAEVTNVRITEDEVVARSFEFRYRKPGSDTENAIEIQFMQDETTKRWTPQPPPPKELP